MEKDEGLKLVNENGETVLMTQSEYLELAKQKGWDTKLPQLEDGTYDCDIFGGDYVKFSFEFAISGTLYMKDNAYFQEKISAREGIILGDTANTFGADIFSDNGDVIIGSHADVCQITGKNVICGDNLFTNGCHVCATDGDVILGFNSELNCEVFHGKVFATKDFICDDESIA